MLTLTSKQRVISFKNPTHLLVLELASIELQTQQRIHTDLTFYVGNSLLSPEIQKSETKNVSQISYSPAPMPITEVENFHSGVPAFTSLSSSMSVATLVVKSVHRKRVAVKNLTKLIRLSYVFSIALLLICCVIFNVVVHEVVDNLSSSVNNISNIAMMRTIGIRTCYYSKSLALIGQGADILETESEIRASLDVSVDLLKNLTLEFKSSLTSEGKSKKEILLKWWDYYGNFIERKNPLFDIIKTHIMKLEKIQETPSEQLDYELWEYPAVQLNMPNFVFTFLNNTVENIVNNSQTSIDDAMEMYSYLLIITTVCYSLCFLLIFLPSIVKLSRITQTLWRVYEVLPAASISILLGMLSDRLNDVHFSETISDTIRSSKHSRKIWIRPTGKQLALGLATVVLWIAIGLFTGLISEFGNHQFFNVLRAKPDYLNLIGLQRSCMERSLYYLREIAWQDEYWSMHRVYQDPYEGYLNSAECAKYAASQTFKLDQQIYKQLTTELLREARSDELTSPHLGRGIYIAIRDTISAMDNVAAELLKGTDWLTATDDLFNYYSQVIDTVSQSQAIYLSNATSLIDSMNFSLQTYSIIFNLAVVFFYVFVIDRLIVNIRQQALCEVMLLKPLTKVVDKDFEIELKKLLAAM